MPKAPSIEFYTVKQAAEELGVSYQTIYRWYYAGQIQAVKRGRNVRIPSTEVDRLGWDTLLAKSK